jgi:hypothetical protein
MSLANSPTAPDETWSRFAARHALGISLALAACGAIFGPPLWRGECPAFRDAGHFYYPMLVHTTERWAAGEVPLWNSLDNAGQPLAADATSAVFYPGRLLLHLPVGMPRAITLFVAAHWLLGLFGARRLAKRFARSTDAQYFAGLCFALCGYVAGQMFNLVFLVGAAWLPWAWDAWEGLRLRRSSRKAALLAIPLAMMVLGGDPQLAFHVALLAMLDSISWRRTTREAANAILEPHLAEDSAGPRHLTWPWFRSRWLVLALGCSLAVGLTAIQVLPSITWTMRTDRAVFDEPRSIWEWAASGNRDENPPSIMALVREPPAGTHEENLYDFSFAPLRLLELVLPGIFGELGPHYQNWLKVLTPRQRWWTNTNYLGLLTIVAAGFVIFHQWSNRLVRSAVFVAAIALISSFGIWGLGAIWNAVQARAGAQGNELHPALGGLYWFWVTFLPGYASFRYPSKWLVIFSLAIGLLAARAFDSLLHHDPDDASAIRMRASLVAIAPHIFVSAACITSSAWIVLLWMGHRPFAAWGDAPGSSLYGPFDVAGSLQAIRFALARTFLVSLVLAMLLFAMKGPMMPLLGRLALIMTVGELLVTVWWGPLFASEASWMRQPAISAIAQKASSHARVYRASSSRVQPPHWRKEFDRNRMQSIRQWEQGTLAPRYHWLTKERVIESRGTSLSADYWALLEFLHRIPPDDLQEPAWTGDYHPLDVLSAEYCIVPLQAAMRGADKLHSPALSDQGIAVWKRRAVPPRVWIAKSVALLPELRRASRSQLVKRTESIFLDNGAFRDLIAETLIESDAAEPLFSKICGAPSRETVAQPQWIVDRPERIEVEIELDRPALLVLGDAFDPGWAAERQTAGEVTPIPVFRANRVLRGVCLPPGQHRVIFRYAPWEIPVGGVISLLAWLVLLPTAIFLRPKFRDRRLHPPFRRRRMQG